jgi:hypothetical protein
MTLRNGHATLSVSTFATGIDKTGADLPVYVLVTSGVLDRTCVRGKIGVLANGRHGGVTAVKGVPR